MTVGDVDYLVHRTTINLKTSNIKSINSILIHTHLKYLSIDKSFKTSTKYV